MRTITALAIFALLVPLSAGPTSAQGFKFSNPDTSAEVAEAAKQQRIAEALSTPCRADLKGKKIMIVSPSGPLGLRIECRHFDAGFAPAVSPAFLQ